MNFSEPGCAATTSTSTTINSSTPLHFARSLFTTLTDNEPTTLTDNQLTNISTFTTHLTAINQAAYLLLLPQSSRAEVEFSNTETSRISNGPLGASILHASTLFLLTNCRADTAANADDLDAMRARHLEIYSATDSMLRDLVEEQERYLDNMKLLLDAMKRKWKKDWIDTGSWHRTARNMGFESGIASAQALSDLVGHRPTPHLFRKTYLSDIARYWRTWAQGTGESKVYEEVWTYVSGRALVEE